MAATRAFTTSTGGSPFINRLYGAASSDDCRTIYDEWADSYDAELYGPTQDYVAPNLVAQALLDTKGDLTGKILDAGCGSGLSGVALSQAGASNIDGIDLSPGMLRVAEKKGVYQSLEPTDLSKPISKDDEVYDAVTCVGTLTHGHVGPVPALSEFARVTRKSGVIVATIIDDV